MNTSRASSSRLGTIIFSIHQPRYSIYKLFDTVLLLSAGHTVYLNSADGLLPYFASHGFKCEEHDNPADFALDVIIHCNSRSSTVLYSAYRRSAMHLHWEECMSNKSLANERYADTSMARSRLDEFYYVCGRTFRNTIRDPAMAASQIIVATLLALLTGLVFNHMQATVDTGVQNRLGAIFFIVVNQIYSTATALEPLVQERALFIHVRPPPFRENRSALIETFALAGERQWVLPSVDLLLRQVDL